MSQPATGLFADANTPANTPDPADEGTEQEQQGEDQQEQDGEDGQEPSVEDLQSEIARLKQEAAQNRIKARNATNALKKATKEPAPAGDDVVAAAEARGREAARLEYGLELAGARVETALKGVVPDESIEGIVEELNLARFVTDEGKVDDDAIKAFAAKLSPIIKKTPRKVSHARSSETPTTDRSEDREFSRTLFGG